MHHPLRKGRALRAALLSSAVAAASAVSIIGLAGCPGDPGAGGGDGTDGGGDRADLAAAPAEVTGTAIDTYVTESGSTQRPRDLSGTDIAAFVLTGPGAFTRLIGIGGADGTFRVPSVPPGVYYLKLGTTYVVTAARTLDVGVAVMGRPDRARATVNPTVLTFSVGNMDAWGVNDGLAIHAANVGGAEPFADVIAQGRPAVADRAVQMGVNWSRAYAPYLIDGARGDRLQLLHLAGRASGTGVSYQSLSQRFAAPSFTLADGGSATATGAFQAVAQDRKLKVSWSRSQFEALRTAVSPLAQSYNHSFQLFAYPQAQAHGDYGAGALLAAIYPAPAATDLDAGELTFGDPYPADWTLTASTGVTFVVGYQIPGAAIGGAAGAIYVLSDDARTAAGAIAPLVGPVAKPLVNGKDGFGALTGVGTSPTLSWSAPTVGVADGYQVFVYRLFAEGGNTRRSLVTTLRTTETTLTLPPGLLDKGSVYTASILAVRRPGADLAARPFRRGLPEGGAAALLGAFAP